MYMMSTAVALTRARLAFVGWNGIAKAPATAQKEWDYVVNQAPREKGDLQKGRSGWSFDDYMKWHGEAG